MIICDVVFLIGGLCVLFVLLDEYLCCLFDWWIICDIVCSIGGLSVMLFV